MLIAVPYFILSLLGEIKICECLQECMMQINIRIHFAVGKKEIPAIGKAHNPYSSP